MSSSYSNCFLVITVGFFRGSNPLNFGLHKCSIYLSVFVKTSVQSVNIDGKKHHGNMEKRIRRKLKQFSKSSIGKLCQKI